jgi:hypothetical protein
MCRRAVTSEMPSRRAISAVDRSSARRLRISHWRSVIARRARAAICARRAEIPAERDSCQTVCGQVAVPRLAVGNRFSGGAALVPRIASAEKLSPPIPDLPGALK